MAYAKPIVLTFAGSDPTCGAGLQGDVLTILDHGCHPLSVITAITAQNTVGVTRCDAISPELIAEQANVLIKDVKPSVVKIGLVPSVECAREIAKVIDNLPGTPVILDPVLTSGRGDKLGALEGIVDVLLPTATLVVPNSVEARSLVARGNQKAIDQLALDDCGPWLASSGAKLVLITGSHENTSTVRNTLYNSDGVVEFEEWPRLPGEYHGSGCMLASSIACLMACGYSVESAVKSAQGYTWEMLHKGYRIGAGQLIPSRNILERDVH